MTTDIRAEQRFLGLKDDNDPGPDTIACRAQAQRDRDTLFHLYSNGGQIISDEVMRPGVVNFVRRYEGTRALTKFDYKERPRERCLVLFQLRNGQWHADSCNTLPTQKSSKQSPKGHVAVVRPGGPWPSKLTTYKGYPALRLGTLPCWRNLSGFTMVTTEDRKRSETMRPGEYPQCNDQGLYATGILAHINPPKGFSIGCFTLRAETLELLRDNAPAGGWVVYLHDNITVANEDAARVV